MKMGIPGEEAEGVMQSLEYLKTVNLGEKAPVGKRVCVVGGRQLGHRRRAGRLPG